MFLKLVYTINVSVIKVFDQSLWSKNFKANAVFQRRLYTLSNTLIKAYFDHRNFDSVNQPLVYLNMLYFDIKRVSVI